MKSFLWLVVSGIAWLVLVQASELLNCPPQLVTIARSASLGCHAMFLLLDLRDDAEGTGVGAVPQGIGLTNLLWFMVPAAPAFVLHATSDEFTLSVGDVLVLGTFYASQLAVLFARQGAGAIRSPRWELLPPVLLSVYLVSVTACVLGALATLAYLSYRLLKEPKASAHVSHWLVIQLPTLLVAPAILVGIRDQFDMQGQLPRDNVETIGMIINGLGASAWMTMVMRAPHVLVRTSGFLWMIGLCIGLSLVILPSGYAAAAVAVLSAELFRGSAWLGTTHIQTRASKLAGFCAGLVAAVLPLCALLLGREVSQTPWLFLMIYGLLHVPFPLAARLIGRTSLGQERNTAETRG
jgi:hypothetical protein